MSDSEEQKSCGVCADFEPQTWRKSLCKHCFHALEEHSKEMLAQQSQAVATEQGADRSSGAPAETCSSKAETKSEATESDLTREEGKGANSEKDVPTKMAKTRFGASKDTSQWSWAKDLGHEYGKSVKPGSHTTTKSTQENQPAPSSSSTPSAPTLASSSKPSVKTSPPSLSSTEISTSSLSKTTSGTTNTAASDTATTMSMSKAKTFASKFEAKASGLTKDKPCWKPPEVRPGSANVAALTGKLTETISDSKSSSKLPAEPQKLSAPQKINSKSAKLSGVVSKTDSPETYADKEVVSTDDSKEDKSDHIAQKLQLAGSKQDSWNKLSVSPDSKSRPSGKEFMRSSKEPGKDDSVHKKTEESKSDFSPAKHDDSGCSSQNSFRDSSSEITYKSKDISLVKSENERNDDKQKKNEHLMILQTSSDITGAWQSDSKMAALNVSCADRLGQHTETASINNLANSAGNSLAVQTRQLCQENTGESKDEDGAEGKCLNRQTEQQTLSVGLTAEIDKLVKESDKRDNVAEDTSQSSVCSDMQVSSSSPVSSSSSKAITSTDSLLSSKFLNSTTDAERKQQSFHLDTSTESRSLQSSLEKFTSPEKPCSFQSPISPGHHANQDKADNGNKDEGNEKSSLDVKENIEKLNEELKEKEDKLSSMTILMSQMQEKVRSLEEERDQLKRASIQSQKSDLEKMLNDLKTQLSNMERQCSQLETDNQSLIDKLRVQEANVKRDQECRGKNSDNIVLEQDLEAAEKELEDLKEENKELQRNIMEMKNEMEEMHDHFREHEHDEFRELQKELDLTAKNCRILQYKLRKAERRNDQIEADRLQYEEKLKMLQDKFDSQDAKHHIRVLEDELRVAKEVSARLRDELDIIEDKRDKALEENRHLTQLLEHTDKRQFRMEMEIDKLRDIVADLKQQLKEVKGGNNKESTPERKVLSSIYSRSID